MILAPMAMLELERRQQSIFCPKLRASSLWLLNQYGRALANHRTSVSLDAMLAGDQHRLIHRWRDTD